MKDFFYQELLFSFAIIFFILNPTLAYSNACELPSAIQRLAVKQGASSLKSYSDVSRNYHAIRGLCAHLLTFSEGSYRWDMLLVLHPQTPYGAFWFLPHDNENSAFDAAVYAVRKYGGGFLSVVSGNRRYHQGQDPNRNFSNSRRKNPSCNKQKRVSFQYTQTVFDIINSFRGSGMPYLALHNNTNAGGISILKSSGSVQAYPAYPLSMIRNGHGLKDQDNLVYMAGTSMRPPKNKLNTLLQNGLNVKYEVVNSGNNDCSMSNYVVLSEMGDYYNIEAQHGDTRTQTKMIDILMEQVMK